MYFCGRLIFIILFVISFSGCSSETDYHSKAVDISVVPEIGETPNRVSLPQGWSDELQANFWFTSQGGKIIPYNWFTWLEQADNQKYFRDSEHMEFLRYLPSPSSEANPSGLPIGFVPAFDDATEESWLAMTCAACHTNQVDYNGTKILVDGAPALANFVLFSNRLVDALNKTNEDDEKFERFAKNVLAEKYDEGSVKALRQTFAQVALMMAERQQVNALPEGFDKDFTSYARVDAFGNIQNAGTAFALHDLANKNAPTGPVSYPFLWGTHQSDVVQWNASAPNVPVIGPLLRNIGEVVGVFGSLSIDEAPFWERVLGRKVRYSADIDLRGLGKLESWVKTLRSPQWPTAYLPAIDSIKAARGSELYAQQCAECHQVISRKDEGDLYIATKTPVNEVKTDPVTAWNADKNQAKTLILEGTKQAVLFGDDFTSESAAITISVNGAVGYMLEHPVESLEAGLMPLRTGNGKDVALRSIESYLEEYSDKRKEISAPKSNVNDDGKYADLVYKARPLNGIWATAPYLHNGSVPNLWQLLQKGDQRVTQFWVGSRSFDPINVGFEIKRGLNLFKVVDGNGNIIPGSSNRGHEYGTDLSDDGKWALVEYMKTL